MKKSELKALINEVVKEVSDDWLTNDQDPNNPETTDQQYKDTAAHNKYNSEMSRRRKENPPSNDEIDAEMGLAETSVGAEDPNNPLYVEFVADMRDEEPFMMGGQKFQFVTAKYPNGKKDIGVYAFSGDIVYGYQAFRQMHNLKENGARNHFNVARKNEPRIAAVIDNNVFPHSSDDIEKMADQHHIHVRFVGDAAFGTETLASYRLVFSGPQGQLDSFVHGLAEENGIEFHDMNNAQQIREVGSGVPSIESGLIDWEKHVTRVAKELSARGYTNNKEKSFNSGGATSDKGPFSKKPKIGESVSGRSLRWKDGFKIEVDNVGNPVGYKSLGMQNSGVKIPDTDDWRRFYVSRDGNTEKLLSPKLKVWYEVDSSG